MPDNVSPGCTTYLAVARAVVTPAVARVGRARVMTSVVLAVPMFACGRLNGRLMLAVSRRTRRMPQASTTHADFVRTRTVLSLSFLKPQRQTLLAGR
jgi:hypothetical protein